MHIFPDHVHDPCGNPYGLQNREKRIGKHDHVRSPLEDYPYTLCGMKGDEPTCNWRRWRDVSCPKCREAMHRLGANP